MDSFFNENLANNIQCISLPLEAIGFILTMIEVLKPELADSIELSIDKYRFPNVYQLKSVKFLIRFHEKKKKVLRNYYYLIRQFLLLLYLIYFIYLFQLVLTCHEGVLYDSATTKTNYVALKLIYLYLFTFAISVISIVYMSHHALDIFVHSMALISEISLSIIKFLNKISNGRAIGTLGLLIAFLGVIGEYYQIFSIHKPIYGLIIIGFFSAGLIFFFRYSGKTYIAERKSKYYVYDGIKDTMTIEETKITRRMMDMQHDFFYLLNYSWNHSLKLSYLILLDYLEDLDETKERMYGFNVELLSKLSKKGWIISNSDIQNTLEKIKNRPKEEYLSSPENK